MTSDEAKRVVIFGATGVVGMALVDVITEEAPKWNIIAVSRSGPTPDGALADRPNVTVVKGDVEDCERAAEICRDVDLVFCAIGYPKNYQAKYWAEHWPKLTDSLLAATSSTKLVFCDNLYAYGAGTNLSPNSSTVPPDLNSKPGIRAIMRQKFQARMEKDPLSIVVIGAADFFGPRVTNSALGDIFFGKIAENSKPLTIGSATTLHDCCYVPDFAKAAYVASINDKSWGKFWVCPHSIKQKTLQVVANDVLSKFDDSNNGPASISVLPAMLLRFLAVFDYWLGSGMLYELKEMLPWWTNDYTVDDSAFVQQMGMTATPYDEALDKTVEFFKQKARDSK